MDDLKSHHPAPARSAQGPATIGQRRSQTTRDRILKSAERLFAQHGVAGVSLNTINKTARQKNKNAVHYHFGGKTGLLQAIYDKHTPVIAARRRQLLLDIEANGETGLRPLIRALAEPVAEEAINPDGGEHYIHISAELIATNTLSCYEPVDTSLRINREEQLAERINAELELPRPLLEMRMLLVTGLLFHGLSDYLRIRAQAQHLPSLTSMPVFVSSLVDSICAMLQMPPSPQTLALLEQPDPT